MDESSLGVHQIKFMIKTSPGFSNGSGVAQHADGTLNFGQVTTWNNCWWLVVDTDLETSWTPIDELDGPLCLDGGNGGVDVLGDNITSVQHATGHVFTVTWITFDHLVGRLKGGVGDFSNGELFMVGFLGGDDWSIGGEREMDTWVWYQVGLEFSKIDVEGTIKSEGGSDGADDLSNKSVQVGVGWSFDVEITSADIVDGFIVNHESTVRVLKGSMGGQDGVVWLNNSGGDLGSWVDSKFKLGFLSVVYRETFHEEGGESRSGATTEGVEDEETLETCTLISQFSDSVKDKVDDFLSDGVVTSGVVVGGIFFASDELFRVEELSVGSSSDLIDYGWFQVNEDGSWDVFTSTSFAEEGVERVVTTTDGLVTWHLTIRLDTVFQTVQFPTGVTDLATGLTNMDGDTFTHIEVLWLKMLKKEGTNLSL